MPMRMPFGKYKDYELNTIPRSYLKWLIEEADLKSGSLRSAIQDVLSGRPLASNPSNSSRPSSYSRSGPVGSYKGEKVQGGLNMRLVPSLPFGPYSGLPVTAAPIDYLKDLYAGRLDERVEGRLRDAIEAEIIMGRRAREEMHEFASALQKVRDNKETIQGMLKENPGGLRDAMNKVMAWRDS